MPIMTDKGRQLEEDIISGHRPEAPNLCHDMSVYDCEWGRAAEPTKRYDAEFNEWRDLMDTLYATNRELFDMIHAEMYTTGLYRVAWTTGEAVVHIRDWVKHCRDNGYVSFVNYCEKKT